MIPSPPCNAHAHAGRHAHRHTITLWLWIWSTWWSPHNCPRQNFLSPRIFPTPIPSRALAPMVSDFYVEYFILVTPFFVLSLALKKSRARIGMTFVRRRKIFSFHPCIQELWYPLYPSNSLGGEAMLCVNQSNLSVASWLLKRPLRWKNCQLYVFELDSIQSLPEGIPFSWCLCWNRKGGRNPGT